MSPGERHHGGGIVLRGTLTGRGPGARMAALLDASVDAERLRRARRVGRAGAVSTLRIGAGAVRGAVTGSQLQDFAAEFRVRPLDARDRADLVEHVRGSPGALAALASGDVPAWLSERLLPADASDIGFGCTCPDEGWGCKHAVALALLVAQDIERYPMRLLTLRDADASALIDAVARPGGAGGAGAAHAAGARNGDASADPFEPAGPLPPLPEPDPSCGGALELLDTARLRSALRLWGPDTAGAERDLERMYRRLTGGADG